MKKTLAAILHYNTTQYTDTVYEILKPYEKNDYDLIVIDNGSDPDKLSQYTTIRLEQNCYFGGGLDFLMQLVLKNTQYDSAMLISSDIILHGYNFCAALRKELFSAENIAVVAPCVLQPEKGQCFWPTNHNWCSKEIRYVPWTDFQCAMLKRNLIEEIVGFGSRFGWVQDVYTGIVCDKKGWKIGVCDWIPIVHFGGGTIKNNQNDPIICQYNTLAQDEMFTYFKNKGLEKELLEYRAKAFNYNHAHNI